VKKYYFFIGLFIVLVISFGCGGNNSAPTNNDGNGGDPGNGEVSFSGDIQPIFNSRCASSDCHGSSTSAELDLRQGAAYGDLFSVRSTRESSFFRVDPGDAQNSYLVIKLEGRQNIGTQMPQIGSNLSPAQIQMIRSWIDAGAMDN
jgi:hypothetical protein